MGRKLTQSEFLKRCKSIWGDLYDFSKVNYQSLKFWLHKLKTIKVITFNLK